MGVVIESKNYSLILIAVQGKKLPLNDTYIQQELFESNYRINVDMYKHKR